VRTAGEIMFHFGNLYVLLQGFVVRLTSCMNLFETIGLHNVNNNNNNFIFLALTQAHLSIQTQ